MKILFIVLLALGSIVTPALAAGGHGGHGSSMGGGSHGGGMAGGGTDNPMPGLHQTQDHAETQSPSNAMWHLGGKAH
jgi:hypothetical protein